MLSITILTTLPAMDWPPRSLRFYWAFPELKALTEQRRAVSLPGGGALFEINTVVPQYSSLLFSGNRDEC